MYTRINLVYQVFPHLGSPIFGTVRLAEALRDQGLLGYEYNISGGEFLDEERLKSAPVLYILGHYPGMGPTIEAAGDQFKATLQSESFFTRKGVPDDDSGMLRDREKLFDLLFTFADADVNTYRVKTVHTHPWADTNDIYPFSDPETNELGFIGPRQGREDWFAQDVNGAIKQEQTKYSNDPYENAKAYNRLLNKYRFLVSMPGRNYNGICGRCWEILAARRVCFQYYNPDTCHLTGKLFRDGVDIVYWSSMEELIDKYQHYLSRPAEADVIAENGYLKFMQGHTQVVRARFLAEKILDEANKAVLV